MSRIVPVEELSGEGRIPVDGKAVAEPVRYEVEIAQEMTQVRSLSGDSDVPA